MNRTIFVDTSAWFAGMAKNDQNNEQAIKCRSQLLRGTTHFITSNLIVHETTMLLERKVSRKEAIRFLKAILYEARVEIIHADESIEIIAYELYQKYKDQDYSITDCVSFAIMHNNQITQCFTFDHHFERMGFEIVPN